MKLSAVLKDPATKLPALILVLLAAIVPFYAWHENTSGFLTDDGLYLLMADFFSPYYDGNIYVDFLAMKNARFPPAFPVVMALFGGGSENMPAAHLATAACFVVSALLLYIWVRRNLAPPQAALVCLFAYAILPESLIYVLELRSEFLYIVFVLAAFLAMDAARRSRDHERELLCLAAILVSASILSRTIGVALLAAFLVHLLVNRVRRKWLYVAIALALPIGWHVIKAVNGYSNLYVADVMRYAGYDGLWRLIATDIPRNGWRMLDAWSAHFSVDAGSLWVHRILAWFLLAAALAGFVRRVRKHCPDTHYVIAYVAVILVWPHPDHMVRFLYPLMPIAFLYVFAGVSTAAPPRTLAAGTWAYTGLSAIMLVLTVPNTIALIDKYNAPVPAGVPDDFRHTRNWLQRDDPRENRLEAEAKHRVISLLNRVPRHLEPDECIYADHILLAMLYSRRPARRLPSNPSAETLHKCEHLFVMNLIVKHGNRYPLNEVGQDRLELVDIEHDSRGTQQAYLFRIRR